METTQATTTLNNLQAAFNGESNANARYTIFAQKADAEGYASVARLFRAAARAEAIHAANHAVVIKKMGQTPQARIEPAEVKSTAENLQVAIQGETYERDVMYPTFLVQARADKNAAAIRTFHYALEAEKDHARLYTEALQNLPAWKDGSREFFVCPECGATRTQLDFAKCSVCGEPKEKFIKID